MPELKEKLEIIVVAPNWDDAKAKLAEVSIDEKVKITRRNINGLFMVLAQLDDSMLTDGFYQKIRDDSICNSPNLSTVFRGYPGAFSYGND